MFLISNRFESAEALGKEKDKRSLARLEARISKQNGEEKSKKKKSKKKTKKRKTGEGEDDDDDEEIYGAKKKRKVSKKKNKAHVHDFKDDTENNQEVCNICGFTVPYDVF